ncbi:hypothetical protein B0J17DRAFT_633570 [Rhizoctonia solani]|nr:hypothetical protein B0J17DRAFT_633570 [Rhizoctonia solani]
MGIGPLRAGRRSALTARSTTSTKTGDWLQFDSYKRTQFGFIVMHYARIFPGFWKAQPSTNNDISSPLASEHPTLVINSKTHHPPPKEVAFASCTYWSAKSSAQYPLTKSRRQRIPPSRKRTQLPAPFRLLVDSGSILDSNSSSVRLSQPTPSGTRASERQDIPLFTPPVRTPISQSPEPTANEKPLETVQAIALRGSDNQNLTSLSGALGQIIASDATNKYDDCLVFRGQGSTDLNAEHLE